MNNFNGISPVYDFLARCVFFNRIQKAQEFYLTKIKPADLVLVIGGGTGVLLKKMPTCLKVDFVEPSKNMIKRAKDRIAKPPIDFLETNFESFSIPKKYDLIICPFFLDLFDQNMLDQIIAKIMDSLDSKGLLIVSDFQIAEQSRWQKGASKIMHLFFRGFAGLQSGRLKDIHANTVKHGFALRHEKYFFRKFIFSKVYERR